MTSQSKAQTTADKIEHSFIIVSISYYRRTFRLALNYSASSISNIFIRACFALAMLCLMNSCAGPKSAMRSLGQQINTAFNGQKGVFAVGFKDLKTGRKLLLNGDSVFHAASTMKTPVMIELYKQAAAGRFSLTDSVELKNEFKSIVDQSLYSLDSMEDGEQDLYRHTGEKRTIKELLYLMITMSSNFATNLVIGLVDAKNVTATMRLAGATKMEIIRGVEDEKAFEKGLINTTNARDLVLLFEKLANGELVNKEASKEMIKVLLNQHFNEIIPARLPPGVSVAHKTGSITGVQHDCGIVFLPDGSSYVLVLLSKDLKDEPAAINAMAEVSRIVYDHVLNSRAGVKRR